MNEQLQSKLVEILSGIQMATKAAGDFAMEQLPDIAQQYVAYGRASSVLFVVIGVGLIVASFYFYRAARKAEHLDAMELVGGIGSVVCVVAGGAMVLINAQSAMLVWFAPKVWLLKELASLVK